jgi:hypothetical protein
MPEVYDFFGNIEIPGVVGLDAITMLKTVPRKRQPAALAT